MKEAVNEEHEGKRKNELTWKIHRLHWEKNRFIFDLMYQRKVMSRELVSRWLREGRAGQDRTGKDRTGQGRAGQGRTGQDKKGSPFCDWI
eukprot:1160098-Pelagomonas_calceolata.AAC.4